MFYVMPSIDSPKIDHSILPLLNLPPEIRNRIYQIITKQSKLVLSRNTRRDVAGLEQCLHGLDTIAGL